MSNRNTGTRDSENNSDNVFNDAGNKNHLFNDCQQVSEAIINR